MSRQATSPSAARQSCRRPSGPPSNAREISGSSAPVPRIVTSARMHEAAPRPGKRYLQVSAGLHGLPSRRSVLRRAARWERRPRQGLNGGLIKLTRCVSRIDQMVRAPDLLGRGAFCYVVGEHRCVNWLRSARQSWELQSFRLPQFRLSGQQTRVRLRLWIKRMRWLEGPPRREA